MWINSQYILSKIIFLWTESPFYPGGEREVGPIDLPLQRNPLTGLPHLRGSSLKGALRSLYILTRANGNESANFIRNIFGSEVKAANYIFHDAEILLFPVRSDQFTFVYLTSRSQIALLNQYLNSVKTDSSQDTKFLDKIESMDENKNFTSVESDIPSKLTVLDGEFLIDNIEKREEVKSLVEFIVKNALPRDNQTKEILPGYNYIMKKIKKNLIVLGDDTLFREIVEKGLVRVTRIRIEPKTKVVKEGALFYQELIPQYTLLFSQIFKSVRLDHEEENDAKSFEEDLRKGLVVNMGGDESTGKGIIRLFSYP